MSDKISINTAGQRDEYVLQFEGHAIGRVPRDEAVWVRRITIPMALPERAERTATKRDDGFRAFAAAWSRLMSQTDPERLPRAWQLDEAFAARQRKIADPG